MEMGLTKKHTPHPDGADAVDMICAKALRRFNRAYPIPVAITRRDGRSESVWVNGTEVPSIHPTCQECTHRGNCENRTNHLRSIETEPQMVTCPAGFLVSLIPLVRDGRVAAMFQLVEPGRIPRAAFQHRVGLIGQILAEVTDDPDGETPRRHRATAMTGPWWRPQKTGTHPQVQKAIAYIEQHLADPHTNVATVARALGINSTYLSHIFSEEMGTRMSRFIANRRIQLAKTLLATTDWQIKRIAFESGHSNADWFSQVFHAYAGMTPCDFRRASRAEKTGDVAN